MKKLIPLCSLFFALGLAGPATASAAKAAGPKASVMEKYDADKNGRLDAVESAAIRKAFADNPDDALLKRFDKDGDGKLSDKEIARMTPGSGKSGGKSGAKEKPDKRDTDKKPEKTKKEGGKKSAGKEKPATAGE
jgi:hypothetical protein